jgi:hypothetical protein
MQVEPAWEAGAASAVHCATYQWTLYMVLASGRRAAYHSVVSHIAGSCAYIRHVAVSALLKMHVDSAQVDVTSHSSTSASGCRVYVPGTVSGSRQ